jgi:hypothetical protein
MPTNFVVTSLTLASLFFIPVALNAVDDAPGTEVDKKPNVAEQIKGEWVLYRNTPNGRFMTIKEHLGDQSVVTTYDPNNKPIQSHRSDYRIDASAAVSIFRYRNKVVLIGPNAGAKEERESAYIFRIDGDRFFEVHGMLTGDKVDPSLIVWERLKNNPIPKPQT